MLKGSQDLSQGFRAELVPSSRKINAERRAQMKKEIQVSKISIIYILNGACDTFEISNFL